MYRISIEFAEFVEAKSEEEAIEKICKFHNLEPDAVIEVEKENGES